MVLLIIFFMVGWYMATGSKTPLVRLIDVVIYGPYLVYLSFQAESVHSYMLGFIGMTTVSYNLRNLLKI